MNNITMTSTRQPHGLYILSFAEMLERFGFYSVQALLVLYAIKAFHYTDADAYNLLAGYSALIYATPVIGGFIADHILGFRRAIYLGAVSYIVGYFLLASENHALFQYALGLLIAGNGFFKSSVSSLVGTLYEKNDPRRDSGFTIFYMCFYVGIASAPIICTYLSTAYGWGYGFGVSALALLFGMGICLFGFRRLGNRGISPPNKPVPSFFTTALFYVGVAFTAIFFGLLVTHTKMVNIGLASFGFLSTCLLLIIAFRETGPRRHHLIALIILMLFSIVFWALYMQMFLSIILFVERNLDRNFLGTVIPTGMFASLEAMFLILFAPLFAALWMYLSNAHWNISTPTKFALGIISSGLCMLLLAAGIHYANPAGLVAIGWIIAAYIVLAWGELFLSPVGLSTVTQLSPPGLVGMLMGIWFMALSASYAVAGWLANFTDIPKTLTNPLITKDIYGHVFAWFGYGALIVAGLLLLATPRLKKMME